MFLQQTMNPWFAVLRASQITMLLLAVAMLFIPHLYQPEEAEAGWWLLAAAVVAGVFLLIEDHPDHCPYCDGHVSTVSEHEEVCTLSGCNTPYVSCQESHTHCSGPCKAVVSSSSEHQYYCYYHKCYYYNCGGSNPHASCD